MRASGPRDWRAAFNLRTTSASSARSTRPRLPSADMSRVSGWPILPAGIHRYLQPVRSRIRKSCTFPEPIDMTNTRKLLAIAVAGLALLWTAGGRAAEPGQAQRPAAPFELHEKEHISIIGNTLAERMQYDGWLETMLYARFPKQELVIRNLGFSGDEVGTRLRSKNFGTPDEWLSGQGAPIGGYEQNRFENTNTRTDVVFAFFGYNESYAGQAGLPAFRQQLTDWIRHTLEQKYNGKSAPRIVLFSPIAHEDLGNPDLPDGKENNQRIALYTQAMSEVAAASGIMFVDLFKPTVQLYESNKAPLTINGIHLNAEGDRLLAQVIDRALFGAPKTYPGPYLESLRQAVVDKDFHWFSRYRVTDGFATYGDRAFLTFIRGNPRDVSLEKIGPVAKEDILPTNYEVLQREAAVLDAMTSNRDRRVWAIASASGLKTSDPKVEDSDTPPLINALTNEPGTGPSGAHVFIDGTEAIQKMTIGSGLKVELFASEKEFPELVNPVQMAFDTKGRLWVAAWKNYPHWQPKDARDDKLLILEDTDGDGKADKRTVFAGDLNNPTGFEFYNNGVIVAQSPNVVFLKDTNGDDKYDTKEIILSGIDSADTHHTANSFVFGPDGALYFQEGTFHHTSVETPYSAAVRCANAGVFRYEPRTQKFDTYISFGFANPHGHVFDRWGRDIVVDGTGSNPYHAALFSGHLDFPQKHGRPPQVWTPRTRPCPGMEVVSSRHFPQEMQGNLLVANVIGFQGILQYR